MARYRGIWRLCYGWCLLFCILPTVEAATRVPVNMPSVQAQVEGAGAAAIESGALKVSSAPLGMGSAGFEYIEAATKNVPVRGILGGTTFGLNTIAGGAKSLLKGGVQALLVGAALDQLLKGVDWVMTDGQLTKPSGADTPLKQMQASISGRLRLIMFLGRALVKPVQYGIVIVGILTLLFRRLIHPRTALFMIVMLTHLPTNTTQMVILGMFGRLVVLVVLAPMEAPCLLRLDLASLILR
ncbi:hypothetical protein QNM99_17085 [Pseudomonas sp. PCH446]